jgi:predicted DNA-binding protein (UPF0251 family)
MSRPCKCRRVAFMPGVTYFKPAGIPLKVLEEVQLSIEEAEAIRLKDLEGLEQEQSAGKMNISRPTFQRILASARRKIADAILNGKAVRIEGGNFEVEFQYFKCANKHEWNIPREELQDNPQLKCPVCGNSEISASKSLLSGIKGGVPCCRRGPGWQKQHCRSSETAEAEEPAAGGKGDGR